jgi:hypothetical protein
MIFHISLEADNPRRAATLLAEVMGGAAAPFPFVGKGSWVAAAGDEHGTIIEIYQRGTELHQGAGDNGAITMTGTGRRHNPAHVAIGTSLSAEAIQAIAKREGWTSKLCRRAGQFGVIELWLDDCQLIEVLTPEMQREYLGMLGPENLHYMLDQREALAA